MASAAELRAPVAGEFGGRVRRDERLSLVSAVGGGAAAGSYDRGDASASRFARNPTVDPGDLSVAEDVLWAAVEPPRGQMIRARYADHHTASLVWTRDDSEGHSGDATGEQRNWWSHDMTQWMSWRRIGQYLSEREETFIVEILVSPHAMKLKHFGCEPDGTCFKWEPGSGY